MRRYAAQVFALFVLAGVTHLGCSEPQSSSPPRPPARLQIIATADVGSDTDVCGCKTKKLGGLTRRATVIAERRAAFDGPTVVVDAGDLFFRRWSIPPRYRAQARRTADLHADALATWGAPAVAVGERDLALGLAVMKGLAARGGFSFVSANLVDRTERKPVFSPYVVVDVDGVKLGLVGASPLLSAEDSAHLVYERAGVLALPLEPAVLAAARKARAAGAELVVGLLHVGQARALALLETLPAATIDFAIVGHDRVADGLRVVAGGQRGFVQAGERGKWVVVAEVDVVAQARGVVDEGLDEAHAGMIRALEEQIAQSRDPAKRARLQRRLDKARSPSPTKVGGDRSAHGLRVSLVEVTETTSEEPRMQARYRGYQSELRALADIAVEDADLEYVGNRTCAECHEPAYAHWKKTGHARAWATMVRTRQTSNLDCIGCHVTGFERPGGPRRLADLKPFRNVGCESCHGPGSEHSNDPSHPMDYGAEVPEQVCAECHRVQGDQKPFKYTARLQQVIGPGHQRSESSGASTRKK